jgi:hypothetical protein
MFLKLKPQFIGKCTDGLEICMTFFIWVRFNTCLKVYVPVKTEYCSNYRRIAYCPVAIDKTMDVALSAGN